TLPEEEDSRSSSAHALQLFLTLSSLRACCVPGTSQHRNQSEHKRTRRSQFTVRATTAGHRGQRPLLVKSNGRPGAGFNKQVTQVERHRAA
uniref:Uncharacterized protein n=1 Tax=Mustela putorius furo TaxID=9669 RepID=M3Z1G8_MUSPF